MCKSCNAYFIYLDSYFDSVTPGEMVTGAISKLIPDQQFESTLTSNIVTSQ